MWHEARKREKATQRLFNDHKKRAEQRREENRIDPNSFLQVSGVKAKLCLDPNVYKQAATSMVPWQGDSKLMIDRFDVRATMELIPKDDTARSKVKTERASRHAGVLDFDESKTMKTLLDYERYRLLIQSDLQGVVEGSRLDLIAKCDIISDAKLRKLKGNRFGTSGETSNIEPPSSAYSRPQASKEQSKRAPSGPSYNSVPPPSSLSGSKSLPQSRSSRKIDRDSGSPDLPRIAENVIDFDDYDDFDPDQVDVKENSKQTFDVAKKYGLSSEELILLSKLDNKDASLKESLGELKALTKKFQTQDKKHSSQQIYGPALPPKLVNRPNGKGADPISSDESATDDGSNSPVPQRSPSGAVLPTRDDSRITDNSDNDTLNGTQVNESPSNLDQIEKPVSNPVASSDIADPSREQNMDSPPNVRRRASTPLAYRRNRRSSRSLSRERRKTESDRRYRRRSNSSSSSSSCSSLYRQHRSRVHSYHQEDRSRKRSRHK